MRIKRDVELVDLRGWWHSWSKRDKDAFKTWIDKLVAVKDEMPSLTPNIHLRLEFCEQVGDDEFHSFTPPIGTIKLAIESWERGEPYTPNSLGELCG
jgi:chitinase